MWSLFGTSNNPLQHDGAASVIYISSVPVDWRSYDTLPVFATTALMDDTMDIKVQITKDFSKQ